VIEKIELKKFGKFTGKTFDLAPFTLFLGDNEAGKSTIFDALVENVCNPAGTNAKAKELKERYGVDRSSTITFKKGDELDIPIEEFLSLYAISSGDVPVNLKDSKSWVDKVMASLITGGVDPKKLYEFFQKYESEKGSLTHNRNKNAILKKLEDCKKEIEEKEQKRKEILSQHSKVDSSQEKLKELDVELKALEPLIRVIEASLVQQTKIRELKRYKEVKKAFIERDRLAGELKASGMFKQDNTVELEKLEAQLQEEKDKHTKSVSNVEAKTPIKTSLSQAVSALVAKQSEASKEQYVTEELLKEVEQNLNLSRSRTANMGWIAVAVLFVLAGVGSYFVVPSLLLSAALAVLGVIAFLAKGFNKGKNVDEFISRKVELLAIKQEYLGLETLIKAKAKELSDVEADLKNAASVVEQADKVVKELVKSRDAWFIKNNVRTKTEYVQKISEYNHKNEAIKILDKKLAAEQEQLNQKSLQDLDTELMIKIQGLEAEITEPEKSDEDVQKEANKLKSKKEELKIKQETKNEMTLQVGSSKSKMEGGLENFDIDGLLRQLSIIEKDKEEQLTEIEGGKIAASIFSQLAKDSSIVFTKLSERTSENYGALLPKPKAVSITSIANDKEIAVEDAGGTSRHPDHLSKGTRDLFYFALRLTLAESSSPEGKVPLLVFDEPFHSLDASRTIKALELLKVFQKEHDCQILMFSKDKSLEKTMKDILKDKLSLVSLG